VREAISDLRLKGKKLIACDDPASPSGFRQIAYIGPESRYQQLMHGSVRQQQMDSLRLPNHRPSTVERFRKILATCRKGVQLSDADRERLGIRKSAIAPLAPDRPSHTLTTLPDDLLHYAEPRIHTVREHARLQSFPDWFEFKGKYTTGGERDTILEVSLQPDLFGNCAGRNSLDQRSEGFVGL
jgi:DNA (cytosine-5)-methyltransferase 1